MASYKFNMDEEYTDDDFGDVEHLVDDQRGFETIAIELASKLPSDSISFEQIVKEIVTSQGLVTVKTSGQSYLAPHVILTASIGVLQSGVIKFEPPLPHWKTEAINRF